jgi:hypothetical protein
VTLLATTDVCSILALFSINITPFHLFAYLPLIAVTLLATTVASKFTVSHGKEQIIQLYSVLFVLFVARTLAEAHFAYGGAIMGGAGLDAEPVFFKQIAQLGNGMVLPVVQLLTSMLLVKQHKGSSSAAVVPVQKQGSSSDDDPSPFLASIDEEEEEEGGEGTQRNNGLKLPPLSSRERERRKEVLFAPSSDSNNDDNEDRDYYNGDSDTSRAHHMCRAWSTTSTEELKMTADSEGTPRERSESASSTGSYTTNRRKKKKKKQN